MTEHTPYYVPKEPGRWRAITLAAAVHVALLVFFWIGIDWQSETPIAVQAEIWDLNAREAAPLAPPKLQPKPEPKVETKPEPKPVVKPLPPKVEPDTPPVPKVDIALEKEKKRKDKLAEQQKQELLKKQKADDQAQKEKAKEQAKEAAKEKAQKEQAEKDKKNKLAEEKKHKQELADAAQRKKAQAAEMRRLTEAVGSGGAGKAEKSQGIGRADASYLQKIGARIRSNTIFNVPEGLSGNPAVEYDVELLPDGSVRGLRLRRSSGLPGFDEAVKRAIDLSQPFPPDNSGRVPSSFTVVHKPKDQ